MYFFFNSLKSSKFEFSKYPGSRLDSDRRTLSFISALQGIYIETFCEYNTKKIALNKCLSRML